VWAGDRAADASLATRSPASADGYLCVVRTIRFNTPEIDKNIESGAIFDGNPARADARLPAMCKEICNPDRDSNRVHDGHITEQIISRYLPVRPLGENTHYE
jgi:hypothetical protein